MLASYRTALAVPGVARVVGAVLVCYLLAGMVNLSLLTSTTHSTGSYTIAGAVVGAYSVAVALTAPVWGRVVDHRGPSWTLGVASAAQFSAFAGYIIATLVDAPAFVLIATAAAAGSCTPPASAIAKKVFAVYDDPDSRRALFSISGLFAEMVFVVGPLIVGGVVAVTQPILAVAITAVVALAGVWWLRAAPAVRSLDATNRDTPRCERSRRTTLDSRQLHVLAVVVLSAVAIGALQVSVIAQAAHLNLNPGPFIAAIACGGVLASFTYGGLALPRSLPAQLAIALALYGVLIVAIGTGPGEAISIALLFLAGAATGPADAIEALLIAHHTPRQAQSQAFAALTTANWLGFAAGSAVAGAAVDRGPLWIGTSIAAAATIIAALSLAVPRWKRRLQ
ncbi:MFS transporter [Kribbella sancticallisti]|uniref:MFS transporter n=1 Tax=Kribbella sancticallisti TaxID=460087 RepID=A0ABN2EDT7_9ACTN